MLVDRYTGSLYARTFAVALGGLAAAALTIRLLLVQLDRILGGAPIAAEVLDDTALALLIRIPAAAVLAALFLAMRLGRGGELEALAGAGMPARRALLAPLVLAFVVPGGLTLLVAEGVIAGRRPPGGPVLLEGARALGAGRALRLGPLRPGGGGARVFDRPVLVERAADGGLQLLVAERLVAPRGEAPALEDGALVRYDDALRPIVEPFARRPLDLGESKRAALVDPSPSPRRAPLSALRDRAGSDRAARVAWLSRLAAPALGGILVLLALPAALRGRGSFVSAARGGARAIAFLALREGLLEAGRQGWIGAEVAVLLAPAAGLALGLALLAGAERPG